MFATFINAIAIIVGSFAGLLLKRGLSKRYEQIIYVASGIVSLVVGVQMAVKTTHILILSFALILGGLVGTLLDIEGGVLRFGEVLKRRFAKGEEGGSFALGFLNASVLFCSGAMAIVGSFKAGTEGDYSIIFTKSVLDFSLSLIFASVMGIGVAFSAFSVFLYQGALTLLSVWAKPYVSPLMLSELTGLGGALVIMVGINLLELKKLKIGDFLPSLVFSVLLVLAVPFVSFL
jgi:uncharacterized membrane protein YqgA involved in biofilm formation